MYAPDAESPLRASDGLDAYSTLHMVIQPSLYVFDATDRGESIVVSEDGQTASVLWGKQVHGTVRASVWLGPGEEATCKLGVAHWEGSGYVQVGVVTRAFTQWDSVMGLDPASWCYGSYAGDNAWFKHNNHNRSHGHPEKR